MKGFVNFIKVVAFVNFKEIRESGFFFNPAETAVISAIRMKFSLLRKGPIYDTRILLFLMISSFTIEIT